MLPIGSLDLIVIAACFLLYADCHGCVVDILIVMVANTS